MHFKCSLGSVVPRILLLLVVVLGLCALSSAALKFSPKSSSKLGSRGDDSEDQSAEVQAHGGQSGSRKSGDYVFAKVTNPKLVRPRSKNSRTEKEEDDDDEGSNEQSKRSIDDAKNTSDEDDPDEDDDDDNDNSEEEEDLEISAIKRGHNKKSTPPAAALKAKKRDHKRDTDRDENSSEVVDESTNKNRKAKTKKTKVRVPDDDDDEDDDDADLIEEPVFVVEESNKKKKRKQKDADSESEPAEKVEKAKHKKIASEPERHKEEPVKKKGKKTSKPQDDDEDDKSTPWWNIMGWFSKNDKDEKDEESFLEVIQKKRDAENEKIKKHNEKTQEPEAEEKSWLSFLNRKPFNIWFDIEPEEEPKDTEPEEKGPPSDGKKKGKRSGPLTTDDFEEILAYIPSFVPNYTSIENMDCRRQGQIFHRQLRGQKLWAFQMIDAGGKIGSGILHGNINQLGNFDLCTEISTKVKITDTMVRVKGKYCLAHMDIQATDENLKYIMHLINGKSLLRSTINDPSHFVPRFTTLNWGVCVPAACTVDDVQEFLEASLEEYNSTGIRLNIQIDENNCYVAHKFHWAQLVKENYEIVAILACVTSILVVVALATLSQYWTNLRAANIVIEIFDGQGGATESREDEEDHMVSLNGCGAEPEPPGLLTALIMQFSLKDTWCYLTALKEGEIECLHGIKALAALGLLGILKVWQLIRAPYANRIDLTEILNSSWSIILRSPMLFMDVFLIITGTLTSYSVLRRLEETGKLGALSSLGGRLFRMIPMIVLTTLFQAHIWPHLGSGPQWNEIVGTHSTLCKENWWKNSLFLQWIGSPKIEEACDPISYQFSVQVFLCLIAPLIIWALYKRPQIGLGVFGAVNAISVAMRFSQTQTNRLAPIFYHGIKMTQIYRTMDLDHGSIIHRATPFINGLGLGFVLIRFGHRVKIPKASNVALWVLSIAGLSWCLFSQTHVTRRDYIYNSQEMAQFAAWVPLIWSLSIMWIIFACYSGNGNFANRFLSAKPLIFISRISYALHFVQYIVLSSISARTRAVGHFEVSHFINTFELLTIGLISVWLTFTFDLPLRNVIDLLRNWPWESYSLTSTEDRKESEPKAQENLNSNSDPPQEETKEVFTVEKERVFDKNDTMENLMKNSTNIESNDQGFYAEDEEDREERLSEEKEYSEEEEEEQVSEGKGALGHEELDSIWGSDNE